MRRKEKGRLGKPCGDSWHRNGKKTKPQINLKKYKEPENSNKITRTEKTNENKIWKPQQ